MSRDTCKKIYDTLCRNADSLLRKLQNPELSIVKMIEQIENYSFLGFISVFAAKSTKIIKKITKFLLAIPQAGKLIQFILLLFGALIGIIIGGAIYAGSRNKGYRLGLERYGWFRYRWASGLTDW